MRRRPLWPSWPSPTLLIAIVALVLALFRGVPSSPGNSPAHRPVGWTSNVSRYSITVTRLHKHRHHRRIRRLRGPVGMRGPTGPQGPVGYRGLTGATGPSGPSGTASVVSHSISFPVPSGQVTIAHLWCPSGQHALGGGYETGSGIASDTGYAIIDAPIGDTNGGPATEGKVPLGWKVYINNPMGASSTTGQLFAICTV
jgi:hypothetical protein